jgi:hypothetical protein
MYRSMVSSRLCPLKREFYRSPRLVRTLTMVDHPCPVSRALSKRSILACKKGPGVGLRDGLWSAQEVVAMASAYFSTGVVARIFRDGCKIRLAVDFEKDSPSTR